MLNYIWLGLIIGAIVLGAVTGKMPDVTKGALDNAKTAFEIAIGLTGFLALWLGMMRLAERSGLTNILARAIRPLMVRLFPDVPPDHPAMGAIIMNMSANVLGLGNAATPLGLRAMKHLEKLNPHPGTASNAMCTFLAVNTSSIQLIPATAIAFLVTAKAANPTAIVGPTLITTFISTIVAIVAVKTLEKLPAYRLPALPPPAPQDTTAIAAPAEEDELILDEAKTRPLHAGGVLLICAFFALFAYAFVALVHPEIIGGTLSAGQQKDGIFIRIVQAISTLAIPFLLGIFPLYGALRGLKVYEEFVEGAKEGFQVAIRIIPYLVAILFAAGMFRLSGGIQLITDGIGPFLNLIGFPPELLPLVLMRPLSGGGSNALFQELITQMGPDNIVTLMGGTILGSSETTFYVIAIYFGSVGIKRTRHAVPAGLIGDLSGVIAAIVICRLIFG